MTVTAEMALEAS